jgi:metallo-beta-lactamase family protein
MGGRLFRLGQWFGPVLICACGAVAQVPTVTVHGGAGEVPGSLAILDTGSRRVMVDCGSYFEPRGADETGQKSARAPDPGALPSGATTVDAVFLTHAHLDHIGRIPALVRSGYSGPIFATAATIKLARPMLLMQIRYDSRRDRMWEWSTAPLRRGDRDGGAAAECDPIVITAHWNSACPWRAQIKPSNLNKAHGTVKEIEGQFKERVRGRLVAVSPCKVCADLDWQKICALMRPLVYGQTASVSAGLRVTALDAGHVPGSASLLFEIVMSTGTRSVLFSGDLGNDRSALMQGPRPAPVADLTVIESTYGRLTDTSVGLAGDDLATFRRECAQDLAAGRLVWIPAFALDRTQKVLHEIERAELDGLVVSGTPVIVTSPTALMVSAIYDSLRSDGCFRPEIGRGSSPTWHPPRLKERLDCRDPLAPRRILVTTSGMLDEAASNQLLGKLLPRSDVTIYLVGWQDPDSPGGILEKITSGSSGMSVALPGAGTIAVRASIRRFHCFSAHATNADVSQWLGIQPKSTKTVLVHGDPEALEGRRAFLAAEGRNNVGIAVRGRAVQVL